MLPLTLFLAKLIGLLFLAFSLAMALNKKGMIAAVADLMRDRGLMLIGGSTNLIAGLAIVLSHNVWSAGALSAIVTSIGWLLLLRGMVWLAAPPAALDAMYGAVRFERHYYAYTAFVFAAGLGLAIAGFAG